MPPKRTKAESKAPKLAKRIKFEEASLDLSVTDCTCSICFEILTEPVKMPCNHELCLTCLRQMVSKVNSLCPMCRMDIDAWMKNARSVRSLINKPRWQQIQRHFPTEVQARLANQTGKIISNTFSKLAPVLQPNVAPVLQPVVAPAPQPVVAPAPQPVVAPAPQHVVAPAPQPVVAPAPQPVVAPAPQRNIVPAPQANIAPVLQPNVATAPQRTIVPAPQANIRPAPLANIVPALQANNRPVPQLNQAPRAAAANNSLYMELVQAQIRYEREAEEKESQRLIRQLIQEEEGMTYDQYVASLNHRGPVTATNAFATATIAPANNTANIAAALPVNAQPNVQVLIRPAHVLASTQQPLAGQNIAPLPHNLINYATGPLYIPNIADMLQLLPSAVTTNNVYNAYHQNNDQPRN